MDFPWKKLGKVWIFLAKVWKSLEKFGGVRSGSKAEIQIDPLPADRTAWKVSPIGARSAPEASMGGTAKGERRLRAERLGLRVDGPTKALIERADRLERRKLTDFCVTAPHGSRPADDRRTRDARPHRPGPVRFLRRPGRSAGAERATAASVRRAQAPGRAVNGETAIRRSSRHAARRPTRSRRHKKRRPDSARIAPLPRGQVIGYTALEATDGAPACESRRRERETEGVGVRCGVKIMSLAGRRY